MSELAVRDRLMDIYRTKAMLGEGGCMNEYLQPQAYGYGEDYASDAFYGGAVKRRKKKLSAYNKFVQEFYAANKGKYTGTELIELAAEAWRSASGKRKKYSGSKKALTAAQLKRIGKRYETRGKRKQCLNRKRDGDFYLDADYDCIYDPVKKRRKKRGGFTVGGLLVGGARKGKPQDHETEKGMVINGRYISKKTLAARAGKRYMTMSRRGACLYPREDGQYYLDPATYKCAKYKPPEVVPTPSMPTMSVPTGPTENASILLQQCLLEKMELQQAQKKLDEEIRALKKTGTIMML